MDFRGARMLGPPPHSSSFRHRGGRGNHHPISNHHHQVQPRQMFNQPIPISHQQWTTQSPHGSQAEGLNYAQPAFMPETVFNNYAHHQPLPSPEHMAPSTQPQAYPYPQPMFIQQPMMYDPATCYQQASPMVPTSPVVPMPEPAAMRNRAPSQFQYNSKDNVTHCVTCGHKNSLAETEIIKRDEKIDSLEKEIQVFRKQIDDMTAENHTLRLKLRDCHMLSEKAIKDESERVSVNVSENVIETSVKENMGDAKKNSPLSPDAVEFSPKETLLSTASAEVPVVSAKGMTDDDGVVHGQEVSTEIEVELFDDVPAEIAGIKESIDCSNEMIEDSADQGKHTVQETNKDSADQVKHTSQETNKDSADQVKHTIQETNKDSTDQVKHTIQETNKDSADQVKNTNWSDEVDRTQVDSPQEPKMGEEKSEVPAANDEWEEGVLPTPPVLPEQNWRTPTDLGSNNAHNDNGWQRPGGRRYNQRGGGRFRHNSGGSKGRRGPNDGDQQFDRTNRQDNRGYGHQHQNRFPKHNEEDWDSPRDNNMSVRNNWVHPRHNERHEGYHNQEQENRSREKETQSREKNNSPKMEEKSDRLRDSNNASPKNAWGKEKSNEETLETKNSRDYTYQAQGAWGKGGLTFNKDDKKETFNRPTSNQNPGYYPNKNRPYQPNMVKEENGDLFTCPGDFSLAHCVAEDFRMGSGIAVKFKEEFGRVGELLDQNVRVGGCAHLEDHGRYIFYLVTKEISIGKPRLEDLQESLRAMKAKCVQFGVKKLAMPQIGCGLDRLSWPRVKSSINEIFQGTDIDIRVYEWNVERVSEAEGNKPDHSNTLRVKYVDDMRLVTIEPETALIIFGTEDGYMDPTATSLNEKHRFEAEYKKAEKKVGEVVVLNEKSKTFDWIFALIVAKNKDEKINFKNIEKCCGQLSQLLRKNKFSFAGIEYLQGWGDDKLFFEKVQTLLRASLAKSIQLWVCIPNANMDISKPIRDKIRDARERERDNRDRGRANFK